MTEQTQLIVSIALMLMGIGGLLYAVVLLNDCQKIIKRMKRRSNWYIRQIDKSLKDY